MTDLNSIFARTARWFSVCVALFLIFILAGSILGTHAAAKSARYVSFDVELTLLEDGSYHVVETQRVRFVDGPFASGHRTLPLARTGGIENIRLSELTPAGTVQYDEAELSDLATKTGVFAIFQFSTDVSIYWSFAQSIAGERTFVLEYDVRDALRVYLDETPPNQQIWWSAFGSELTEETRVDSATMTINLPTSVPLEEVVLGEDGKDVPNDHTRDGQAFEWAQNAFERGDDFTVRLQFPPIVNASAPSWQEQDDLERAEEEKEKQRDAELTVILLAAGLALATGGGIGTYGLWYTRGRDPFVGLAADFLPTPPSDLPAGVVGSLLDERADEHDVVATMFDLGEKGALKITDSGLLGPLKRAAGHDYILEVVNPDVPLRPAEQAVLNAIFGSSPPAGTKTSLKDAGPRILERAPEIKEALYQELVERGFFSSSPAKSRSGWRMFGIAIEIYAVAFGIIGFFAISKMTLFPAIVLLVLGMAVIRMSRAMPRKTKAGAEEAAKWRAFRRYLEDLDKYDQVRESSAIIQRYLSYAIAFECESVWLTRYEPSGSISFDWLEVFGRNPELPRRPTTTHWGGSVGNLDVPDVDLPNVGRGMQDLSTGAAHGIQGGSDDLSDVLNVVGAIFEVIGAFSGGGSSGGSSGGGGGGFS